MGGVFMSETPAYKNENLSFEERAKDLVSRMTLEEKVMQMMNKAPAIPRLGVPSYNWWNEALHGVARAGVATVFPQAIGIASMFDEDLIYRVADIFSRIFKEATEKKFHDYLNEFRVRKAEKLLVKEDSTVVQAACAAGFNSMATFNRIFKKVKGCTPTSYRKMLI